MLWNKILDNKNLTSFTNIAIQSILVTNIWILLYKVVLVNLRTNFIPKDTGEFLMPLNFPKPFDVPLYLGLTVVFVILIYAIHKFFFIIQKTSKENGKTTHLLLKLAFLFFLIILFLNNIGKYPLLNRQYSYAPHFEPHIYIVFLVISFIFFLFSLAQTVILEKVLKRHMIIFITLFYLVVMFVIALSTFDVNFPVSWNPYDFFFGPVWEITHGKTIFTQTASQYGFVSILLLSVLYKISIFNLAILPVITWILAILQYFLCFYLIYKISRSAPFALIGLLSILIFLFSMPAILPNYTFRWVPLLLAIFFIYRLKRIDSKLFIFILSILSFFTVDPGLYLLFTFVFSLFLFILNRVITFRKAAVALLTLSFSLFVIFALLNLVHIFFGYKPIDLFQVFARLSTFAKGGLLLSSMTATTYFWFVLLIFFFVIILFFKRLVLPEDVQVVIFTTALNFFTGLYFIGNSKVEYLFPISLFIILNYFIVIGSFFKKIKSGRNKIFLLLFLSLFFIVYPTIQRYEAITDYLVTKFNSFITPNPFTSHAYEIINEKLSKDANLIRRNMKDKKILIIENDDTYLFYLTKKENILNINPIGSIVTKSELDFATTDAIRSCPKTIAVDCYYVNRCSVEHFKNMLNPSWMWVDKFVLEKIETDCKIKYQPVICTDNICIAKAQS